VGHGLSFNPTNAKTVAGDHLTVKNGVFKMLYEHRVGRPIAVGRLLPIRRLLSQIPEIGTQIDTVNLGHTRGGRIQQALAQDGQNWWSLLAFWTQYPLTEGANVTARRLRRYFRPVKPPTQWRDIFVVGPATTGMPQCFESKLLIPKLSNSTVPREVFDLVKPIRDIIGMSTGGAARDGGSAALAPSFYETSMLPMPPSLARYALIYYASSLVRYKPQFFDSTLLPNQAYLFNAISRECALSHCLKTSSLQSKVAGICFTRKNNRRGGEGSLRGRAGFTAHVAYSGGKDSTVVLDFHYVCGGCEDKPRR
jgi:hypothetical protein